MSSEEDSSLKLPETQELVAELEKQNADLQEKYEDCKKQAINYYQKLRNWVQKAQNLEKTLKEKEKSIEDLKSNVEEKQRSNAELISKVEKTEQELVQLKEENRRLLDETEQTSPLITRLQTTEQDFDQLNQQLDGKMKQISDLTTKLQASEQELERLRKENRDLSNEHEQISEAASTALVLNRHVRQLLEESERGKIFLMILELGGECDIDELASELNMPPVLVLQQLRYFYTQKLVGLNLEDREVWLLEEEE